MVGGSRLRASAPASVDITDSCGRFEVDRIINIGLIKKGENHHIHRMIANQSRSDPVGGIDCSGVNITRGKNTMRVMIVVDCQAHLFQIVLTGGTTGRFACLLDSGKQQGDQDRNNCDDNQ